MLVKICGLTDPREASYLNNSGADYAGFVLFSPKNPHNITIKQAAAISAELRKNIIRTAVVVSPTEEQIKQIEDAGFDRIQVHGRLTERETENVRIPIIRVINGRNLSEVERWKNCDSVSAFLFEAAEPGSGSHFDWTSLSGLNLGGKKKILGGDLTPGNVQYAIRVVRPDAVDASIGVEFRSHKGKDPEKVQDFIQAAKDAE